MNAITVDDKSIIKSIETNLLLNILIDGIEWAARGFWAQIDEYKWHWWYAKDEKEIDGINTDIISPDLTIDSVLMRIRDDEDGEAENENRPFTNITLQKLADTTMWALESYHHLFTHTTIENGIITDIGYDAIGADVILQKIVLGDVVYG